jgi:hypothetical protein
MVASEMTLASTLNPFFDLAFSFLESVLCDSTSAESKSFEGDCWIPVTVSEVSSWLGCSFDRSSGSLRHKSSPTSRAS